MSAPTSKPPPAPLPPCGHPFTRPGEKCQHCGAITWAPLYQTTEELRRAGG